jgi:hypothetical protein
MFQRFRIVILQMRLYALYSLNKRILALMVSMFLISTGISAAVMGMVLSDVKSAFYILHETRNSHLGY